jgi:SAM-dependent methyltransferase
MPSIAQNRENWDNPDKWIRDGEEWSSSWGTTQTMWLTTILPRIGSMLPAEHLLEIACGHGRITAQLLQHCGRYTGIDLAPSCVAFCRNRFPSAKHASFHETDGRTMPMVGDASIDFAFSWDSLVHAEADAVLGYLAELGRVLKPGGRAFLHHSNLKDFVVDGSLSISNKHWRATTVGAELVRSAAASHGLHAEAQELVQWGQPETNDCFTLLRRPLPGDGLADTRITKHPDLSAEMYLARHLGLTWRGEGLAPQAH